MSHAEFDKFDSFMLSLYNLEDREGRSSPWMALAADRCRFHVTSHGSVGLGRLWTVVGIRWVKRWQLDREVHMIKHIVRHSLELTYRDCDPDIRETEKSETYIQ